MASARPDAEEQHVSGAFFGGEVKMDPWDMARGWLTAFDASTGKENWKLAMRKPMIGAIVATAGDLVFACELTGELDAIDAGSGSLLKSLALDGPAGGGLITFEAGGDQRIAVVSGFVGYYNILAPELGGANPTITLFALQP